MTRATSSRGSRRPRALSVPRVLPILADLSLAAAASGDRHSDAGQTFASRHGFTAPASCETGAVWMAFP